MAKISELRKQTGKEREHLFKMEASVESASDEVPQVGQTDISEKQETEISNKDDGGNF